MPALYKALLASDAVYVGLQVNRIFPLPVTIADQNVTGGGAGTAAGDILPRQVSGIITKRTAFSGKKYRGRIYLPFPAEGDNDPVIGSPVAGYTTRLDTFKASLFGNWTISSGGNGAVMVPIVWHADTSTYDDVVGSTSRPFWATQKRRGSYGEPNPFPLA